MHLKHVQQLASPTAERHERGSMQALLAVLAVLYILSQAFDSLLRWLFDMVGAAGLIYLRDVDLIVIVALSCYALARENRDVARVFLLLCIFALGACVSLYSGLNIPQTLFGIKVWLPLIAGFALAEVQAVQSMDKPRAWSVLWLVVCAGIFLNYFYRYPWTGLVVDVGGTAISANREWNALGVQRISGFSRTSYDGAIIVLLLYLYLVIRLKSLWTKLPLILISGAAIALTTTKGAAGAFAGTLLVLPALHSIRKPGSGLKALLVAGLLSLALLGLVVPLVSLQLPFPQLREGSAEHWLLASLLSRAWETWPYALSLVSDWQILTGRGLGGIGAAQYAYEPGAANPADNLFVYLYVTAGLCGAFFYVFCAFAATRLRLEQDMHRLAYLLLFCLFAYGLTVNIIESAVFAMVLGGLVACVVAIRPQPVAANVPVEAHLFGRAFLKPR